MPWAKPGHPLQPLGLDEVGDGARVAGLDEVPGPGGRPRPAGTTPGQSTSLPSRWMLLGSKDCRKFGRVRPVPAVRAQQPGQPLLQRRGPALRK